MNKEDLDQISNINTELGKQIENNKIMTSLSSMHITKAAAAPNSILRKELDGIPIFTYRDFRANSISQLSGQRGASDNKFIYCFFSVEWAASIYIQQSLRSLIPQAPRIEFRLYSKSSDLEKNDFIVKITIDCTSYAANNILMQDEKAYSIFKVCGNLHLLEGVSQLVSAEKADPGTLAFSV